MQYLIQPPHVVRLPYWRSFHRYRLTPKANTTPEPLQFPLVAVKTPKKSFHTEAPWKRAYTAVADRQILPSHLVIALHYPLHLYSLNVVMVIGCWLLVIAKSESRCESTFLHA